MAWLSVNVFSGKKASLIPLSSSEPANAPIPITELVRQWFAGFGLVKLREICDCEFEVRVTGGIERGKRCR